jgi:flagellar basal-body rod modification protein FlgD
MSGVTTMQVSTLRAAEARDQFLNLLVAQLRNQDPLDPVKQHDFLQQLAQFSTLEQIENLNQNFDRQISVQEDLYRLQNLTYATDLIGRGIDYVGHDQEEKAGVLSKVEIKDGGMLFTVGNDKITVEQILQIGLAREALESREESKSTQKLDT